jgi:hypothetical protein
MGSIDQGRFADYIRGQWAPAGYDVSAVSEAPYKELNKPLPDGWSFGLTVARSDNPIQKARVGVWFRPAPKGGINDLSALRTHYQQKLAQQGRGCRIHNCGTEPGSIFLLWETTAPLPQANFKDWVAMVDELSALCFDQEGLDNFFAE